MARTTATSPRTATSTRAADDAEPNRAASGPSGFDGQAPTVLLDGDVVLIRGLVARGAPADAVRRRIENGGDAEDCVRQMLDVGGLVLQHGEQSSLARTIVAEIRREGLALDAIRAVEERMSAKGLRYEEQVQPVVERAFAAFGDIVEATGGVTGRDGRNKKGDVTVTLDPETVGGRDCRVVIEAKDVPSQKLGGRNGALTYLAAAMDNRDAAAGLLVASGETPALAGHRLRVYPGARVLVRFDKDGGDDLALEIGCQLARALAVRASGGVDTVSTEAVAEHVARLRSSIERAKEIHGGVLEARRGIGRVHDAYELMRDEALGILGEIEDELAG